jgi:hypothetical protein
MKATFWHGGLRKDKWECLMNTGFYRPPGIAALAALTPEKMAHLSAGEAYVWSSKATDEAFSRGAVKMHCRPRVTRHGGTTKTAVSHA